MKTIYKYRISLAADFQTIDVHDGAQFLHVAEQHGEICLWAIVDSEADMVSRRIRVIGTGLSAEDVKFEQHIGSVLVLNGTYVFHIFDVGNTPLVQ